MRAALGRGKGAIALLQDDVPGARAGSSAVGACLPDGAPAAPGAVEGATTRLDFGGLSDLIYFQNDTSLDLDDLNITGKNGAQLLPACTGCHCTAPSPPPYAPKRPFALPLSAGVADSQLGQWPTNIKSPTVAQTLPLWPTIGADPGFQASAVACC